MSIISKKADMIFTFFDNIGHLLLFFATVVFFAGVLFDAELTKSVMAGIILVCLCFYITKKSYDASLMALLAVVSLAGRFFLVLIFNYVFKGFGADSVEYHQAAIGVEDLLINGVGISSISMFKGQIFTYIISVIYFLFGTSRVLATFIVSFFAVITGVVVHNTCVAAGMDKRVGYFASVAIWFMPGFIFFTSDLLRDSIILFLTAVTFYLFAVLLYKKNTKVKIFILLAALIAVVALNASIRFYVFAPILAGLGLGAIVCFFSNKDIKYKAVIVFGFIALVWLFFVLSQKHLTRWISLDIDELFKSISGTRQGAFAYASAGIKDFDVSTWDKALAALPALIGHYIFQPFPNSWFAAGSELYIKLLIPDMILWYGMIPFFVIGSWEVLRSRNFLGIAMIGFLISFLILNALLVGNVGAIYRYRMQFQEFAFVIAGVGFCKYILVRFKEKRGKHVDS